MNHKEQLLSLLGLANSATDDEISFANASFQKDMVGYKEQMDAAIANARDEVAVANAATTDSNERIVSLQNRTVGLLEELANRDVEAFKSVISDPVAVRESLISNRDATFKFLNGLKAIPAAVAPVQAPASVPLHNSKTAGQPAPVTDGTAAMSDADSKWVSNRATLLMKGTKGLSHRDAFHMARNEQTAATEKK